jgi:hypothetical protein
MQMKIAEDVKLAIMGKLHAGVSPRELVEEFQIPYPKILSYKHELKKAKIAGNLSTLVNVDEIIVEGVAHQVEQQLLAMDPDAAAEIRSVVGEVVAGAKGLHVLDTKLQAIALQAAQKLQDRVDDRDIHLKDVGYIVDCLCRMQTAFFNRGTQVNIQNNNGESGFKKFLGK